MSPLISLLSLVILFASLNFGGRTLAAELTCENASAKLSKLCAGFDSEVSNLIAFNEFHLIYRQVNECIIKKTDPETLSISEQVCAKNGIVFASVERLGQLVERLINLEPICTLEFAARLNQLKRSLSSIGSDNRNLMRILNLLGQQIAGGCKKSLHIRLLEVEERAKDSVKHMQLINGLLLEPEKLIELGELPAELFVPVLESEQLLTPSSELSPIAFEFNKIPPQAKIANDLVLGVSCKTLKLYHVNLLGSLGLLASIGFAAEPSPGEPIEQDRDLRLRRWLVSALVCQSLRAATRFGANTAAGNREFDVSLDEEFATEFASFQLAESKGDISQAVGPEENSSVAQLKTRLNLRKLQLMNGLSYRLASTIYDYKNLKGRTDGLRLANNLIGELQVNLAELSNEGGNALTGSLLNACRSFASSIKSLEGFAEFYSKFSQLNGDLRRANLSEPSKAAQTVELVCEQNGITYASSVQLGQLVERWLKNDQLVCAQEFAIKLVRTREQLLSIEQDEEPKLMTILSLLANKLLIKCRSSLSKRLEMVELGKPELIKNLLIVNNNLAEQDEIERLSGVIPIESYLPIMESELRLNSLSSKSELSHEFKLSQQVRTVLDSTRLSCKLLKPYQVNLLGSIGLLASAGYSAEMAEGEGAKLRLTRWILSSILCQSQLATSKVAGAVKSADRIRIGQIEQADVELADEWNSAYLLEALTRNEDGNENEFPTATIRANSPISRELSKFVNLRRIQLIDGPNYKLASSIYNYLDLNSSDRFGIVSGLLGWDISQMVAKNDEEDEEDDE